MTFERTFDLELVREIVTHPQVYRQSLLSDFAPSAAAWTANPAHVYLLPRMNGQPLGVFIFEPRNPIHWEAHLCMLPCAWGEQSLEACLGAVAWLQQNTICRKLTASVPHFNRLMHALARRIGMTAIGVNEASISKDGKLFSQTIFGLTL